MATKGSLAQGVRKLRASFGARWSKPAAAQASRKVCACFGASSPIHLFYKAAMAAMRAAGWARGVAQCGLGALTDVPGTLRRPPEAFGGYPKKCERSFDAMHKVFTLFCRASLPFSGYLGAVLGASQGPLGATLGVPGTLRRPPEAFGDHPNMIEESSKSADALSGLLLLLKIFRQKENF